MDQQGREQLFFKILVFFSVITAITGIFNLANAGTITLGDLGSGDYMQTIPGQATPGSFSPGLSGYTEAANTANGTVITDIDFTTATSINSNVNTLIGGPWTLVSGQGVVLTGLPFLSGVLNPSAVILRNAQSDGSVYSASVKVDNVYGDDFYVFPRFVDGYSGSDLKVVFSYDGIHVKKFPLYLGFLENGDDYFYPMQDAEVTAAGGSTITSALTEAVSSQTSNTPDYTAVLTITKDGTELFTVPVRSILPGANINDQVRHGGAGSDKVGFVVMGFPNTNLLDTSASLISGSTSTVDQVLSAFAIAEQLWTLLTTILGLTSNSLVPFWIWAIIAIPCITTLVFMYIEIARGV
jgi:hypothetical protein